MMEPTAAWERGERRRTRTIAALVVVVALLAVAVYRLASLTVDQRERLNIVGQQNDALVVLLNERTPVIAHIDDAVTRIECLIEEQAELLVDGVVVLLDDEDDAAVAELRAQLELLQESLDGICEED